MFKNGNMYLLVGYPQVFIVPAGSSSRDSVPAAGSNHGHPVSSGFAGQAGRRAVRGGEGETAEEHPGAEGTLRGLADAG